MPPCNLSGIVLEEGNGSFPPGYDEAHAQAILTCARAVLHRGVANSERLMQIARAHLENVGR